jgi:hypothetical protein
MRAGLGPSECAHLFVLAPTPCLSKLPILFVVYTLPQLMYAPRTQQLKIFYIIVSKNSKISGPNMSGIVSLIVKTPA